MREHQTPYGRVLIGDRDALFQKKADLIIAAASKQRDFSVGLTGGSTPLAFYDWAVENDALTPEVCKHAFWLTSDERFVPRSSEDSNMGNADRRLLDFYKIPEKRRMAWPTHVDPHSASIVFNRKWNERFGAHRCFDLAFFGMGNDGHTASLFPGSPLIGMPMPDNFAAVEVPEKGWRLTTTEAGMQRCEQIVVSVLGEGKAKRLHEVLTSKPDPERLPAQIYSKTAEHTLWLVDEAAASELNFGAES